MNKPSFLRSNYLYLLGLILLVTGMPLSLFLTSLSQFVLAGSFFLEGNFIEKFKRVFRNKAALAIIGILLMHVIGMIWTTNTDEGWKDVRIKLPLLALTVIIVGNDPLNLKQFKLVLGFFIAAVFSGTMVSMAVLGGITHHDVNDIRNVFIFGISHIRFALFTCIATFILIHELFSVVSSFKTKLLYAVLSAWFIGFLFIVDSLTGLSIILVVFLLLIFYKGWVAKKQLSKIILIALFFIIPTVVFISLKNIYDKYYTAKPYPVNINDKTSEGNSYTFDFSSSDLENGYPVWVYMCTQELQREWNVRSAINYDSLDKRNQPIKFTLIRFLASKGLRKDAGGVNQLSREEIISIENGIANINYQDISNLSARLMQIVWEYDHFIRGGDPSGHSVMQRLEFWQAATGIINQHPFFGVGTGDMPQAYHKQYQEMNTKLDTNHWLRAHNQYLAIAVAFGIFGLLLFVFALIYPGIVMNKMHDYFYLTFLITALLSMLTEDTLETQAGATFFAFFNAFFLFTRNDELRSKV